MAADVAMVGSVYKWRHIFRANQVFVFHWNFCYKFYNFSAFIFPSGHIGIMFSWLGYGESQEPKQEEKKDENEGKNDEELKKDGDEVNKEKDEKDEAVESKQQESESKDYDREIPASNLQQDLDYAKDMAKNVGSKYFFLNIDELIRIFCVVFFICFVKYLNYLKWGRWNVAIILLCIIYKSW